MNKIILFDFEGNNVRTTLINHIPYFVGNDVSRVLGYSNYRKATADHVDPEDKLRTQIGDAGQNRETTLITESGVYSLILTSKLPSAKRFKHWVTSEVLPAIRKDGAYVTPKTAEEWLNNPDMMIQVLQRYKDDQARIKQLHDENRKLQPKADFADAVAVSKGVIPVGSMATLLKQNGIDIGQNRFFKYLRKHGYLISSGYRYNSPTQRSLNLGIMKVRETVINTNHGTVSHFTPLVTGKGQRYFINHFLGQKEVGGRFARSQN